MPYHIWCYPTLLITAVSDLIAKQASKQALGTKETEITYFLCVNKLLMNIYIATNNIHIR